MATVKKTTTSPAAAKKAAYVSPAAPPEDKAAMLPQPEEEAPAAAAAEPTTTKALGNSGKFAFTMELLPEVPASLLSGTKARSAVELPFKDWFGQMPHNRHVFLPHSFWTSDKSEGGRGVAEDKATVGYVRAKINGSFNEWAKKHPELAEGRRIVLYPRVKGEDSGRFTEAGMSIFMQITKAEDAE